MASEALQELIEMFRSRPVPETPPTIEEMRGGMELFSAPPLEDVAHEPVDAGGVTAEWQTATGADTDRVVLYVHGGGYILGSIATHRNLTGRISKAANCRVLSLDYRLAPEHPFPAAVDDAVAAYRWLLDQGFEPARIVIAGDSAGGGLTTATLVALKGAGLPQPAAGVCLSPWVDMEGTGESMTARAALDPMVQKDGLGDMAAMYLNGADPRTPLAAPLYADLSGLPPLLIHVGTSETLYDDATRLAAKAEAAGVDVTLEPWEEMIHVFQLFPQLPEANEAVARIGNFVRERTGAATPA